ncbi:MAG: DNA polymerase IV [Candidatus Poseidoniaceae archaeon]|nr:DNA polymerase IV [Candidatus Poseidoniaceae archaeon]
MDGERIIIHCDMDAFFAAVETLHHDLDPEVPLILGSDPQNGRGRGIVSTCNYAARKYGIHSAMAISEAWRRCPGAPIGEGMYMRSTRGLYRRASRKVMEILATEADRFEKASVDEAYLDITSKVDGDWDSALALARELQSRILQRLGLSSSFGIGPTRIVAKMSSEENKPAGIHMVRSGEVMNFFADRPTREVPGIGPSSANRLAEWGIETMDEAYAMGELALARVTSERFAKWAIRVVEGETSNQVSPLRSRKSIGKEYTFDKDQTDMQVVIEKLAILIDKVVDRMRGMGISARVAEVKIRYAGFETHTNHRSIPVAMDEGEIFHRLARRLFAQNCDFDRPVRLIGFRVGGLEMPDTKQTTLDWEEE